ncbi:1-pyrroline-5-carboxylate dehydrogenase [Kwoniella sp. B9012]
MSSTSTTFIVPKIENEYMPTYPPGSAERAAIDAALVEMKKQMPFEVPCVINGEPVKTGQLVKQLTPDSVNTAPLCQYHAATPEVVADAIKGAVSAQRAWAATSWYDRATIFLKAAALVSGKYRNQLIAATMLGQGKNVWQADIDAIAELADFFKFSVKLVDDGYKQQPLIVPDDAVNRIEYRPLEGFVLAVSPFNFTAIGGNLVTVPSILGGVCVWKPSPMSTYANYLTHKILLEAGVPGSVIQFVPGDAPKIVDQCLSHRDFAALHFTGSTDVLRSLWTKIGSQMTSYRSYPRIVGETGGKNFHLIHKSADINATVIHCIRSGFEYCGQKCSALSRLYLPRSLFEAGWLDEFVKQTKEIKVGPVTDHVNFTGPVINEASFERILSIVKQAKEEGGKILVGGSGDKSEGYFVEPTIILTEDPHSLTMRKEVFGPVVTVFIYEDDKWAETCDLIDNTTDYALTGSVFSNDRAALAEASDLLRNAAGNLYLNDKTTGAAVGQQPFGGSRGSGTNDKSGTWAHFSRFVSSRTIKENFGADPTDFRHPSNFA